jgi:uncharacterized protein
MKRRNLLKLLGATAIAGLGGYSIWIEPEQITTSQHRLADHFAPIHPAPSQGNPLKIVQITDLHIKRLDRFNRRIADTVNQLQPDLLLLTGDIVDRPQNLTVLQGFLELIDPKPAKYAILGNWEHYASVDLPQLKALYAQFNCPLLVNESRVHEHQGRSLLLTGLDDTVEGTPNLTAALSGHQPSANHLILAHAPDQRDRFTPAEQQLLQKFQPQLMLSGHTHGGQIRLFNFAPGLPRGSGHYISGWFDAGLPPGDRAPQLYVSRGLGGSSIRARFGASPEIAVFEWNLASADAQPTG